MITSELAEHLTPYLLNTYHFYSAHTHSYLSLNTTLCYLPPSSSTWAVANFWSAAIKCTPTTESLEIILPFPAGSQTGNLPGTGLLYWSKGRGGTILIESEWTPCVQKKMCCGFEKLKWLWATQTYLQSLLILSEPLKNRQWIHLDFALNIAKMCCLRLWYSPRSHAICLACCLEIPSMNGLYADWQLSIFWTISVCRFGIFWRRDSRTELRLIIAIGLHKEHGCTLHRKWKEKLLRGQKMASILLRTLVLNSNLFGCVCCSRCQAYLHAKERRKRNRTGQRPRCFSFSADWHRWCLQRWTENILASCPQTTQQH